MCERFSWLIVDWMHIREVEELLLFKEHCRRDVLEFSEEFDKYLIFVTEEEMKRDDS